MVSPSSLLGAAGEHFIMSALLRRGLIAALAPVGVPLTDIIVTDDIGERLCAIQVKTRRAIGSDGGWHMSDKHETISSPTLFYAFVDFGLDAFSSPKVYVVPSAIVAEVVRASHQAWLSQPGKGGKPHKDGPLRRFLPSYDHLKMADYAAGWLEKYRDAWSLLRQVAETKTA